MDEDDDEVVVLLVFLVVQGLEVDEVEVDVDVLVGELVVVEQCM